MNNFVIKFDYNLEALQQIAKEAENIDTTDLKIVKEEHKKFVKIRTTIKKQEKEMVDEANKFRGDVFSKRDEYLAITEPIEAKLKGILDAEEARQIMEARIVLLPSKKEQLSMLDISPVTDEQILAMDDIQWVTFFQEKMAENQRNITAKAIAKKNEEDRIVREAQIKKDAEAKAEKEKQDIIARMAKEQTEAVEKAKLEAQQKIDKEKKDKEIADQKELEAKKKMEADQKYQDFLKANNFNSQTDIVQNVGSDVKIYRLVAVYNK
jgi:hypothetical protein